MLTIPLLNHPFCGLVTHSFFLRIPAPLSWTFSSMEQGVLLRQERDIATFRKTLYPARLRNEKKKRKEKEIMKDSSLCCSAHRISCSF